MIYINMENFEKLIEGKFYIRLFAARFGLYCKSPGRKQRLYYERERSQFVIIRAAILRRGLQPLLLIVLRRRRMTCRDE
jgi:hypothetical protein